MRRGARVGARLGVCTALAAIRAYQRWLSPHKGFCCALRAATGGESCSAYGYRVIERFGLRRGLGLLDRRLGLCSHVHRTMTPPRPARHPRFFKERGSCDPSCEDGACAGGDCTSDGWTWNCGDSSTTRTDRDSARLDAAARRARTRQQRKRRQPGQDPDGAPPASK
jgi:putative component of membrane protein insertase Oxa1/YidC/SpoIIIJ protein YidD